MVQSTDCTLRVLTREVGMSQVGDPRKKIVIEPVEEPVPSKEPVSVPQSEPVKAPAGK